MMLPNAHSGHRCQCISKLRGISGTKAACKIPSALERKHGILATLGTRKQASRCAGSGRSFICWLSAEHRFLSLAVFHNILKLAPPVAAVVEHAIEDNAHPARVYTVYQPPQVILCTEGRVDLKVVDRVIFVVRRRAEDRRQIQARRAE